MRPLVRRPFPMRPTPLARRFLFFFLTGSIPCLPAGSTVRAQDMTSAPHPQAMATQSETTDASLAAREVVRIDGREFVVSKPWAGHRVVVPADTVAKLQLIPPDLTCNRTKIHLRNEAIEPLKAMAAAAREDKVVLLVDSGFRSVRYQRQIIRQFLEKGGRFEHITRNIAPPGYSEHALGTVVDFAPSSRGFANSKAYAWLKRHAAEFGFHEDMPRSRRGGMPWEPWHWKYQPDSELAASTPASNTPGAAAAPATGETHVEAATPAQPVITIHPISTSAPLSLPR